MDNYDEEKICKCKEYYSRWNSLQLALHQQCISCSCGWRKEGSLIEVIWQLQLALNATEIFIWRRPYLVLCHLIKLAPLIHWKYEYSTRHVDNIIVHNSVPPQLYLLSLRHFCIPPLHCSPQPNRDANNFHICISICRMPMASWRYNWVRLLMKLNLYSRQAAEEAAICWRVGANRNAQRMSKFLFVWLHSPSFGIDDDDVAITMTIIVLMG